MSYKVYVMDGKEFDGSIPEYFSGRCIFITGASGFIGKVLIEKFLRSCPDLQSIYVLLRGKKGKSLEERVKEITNLPLFEKIREQNEEALKKIIPILGDVTQPKLGISRNDWDILISNVNVLYHCAASVRFDDYLKDAIITNVRSTRDLLNKTKQFKQLDAFIHVSTAYCNVDKQIIEEKIYPALSDWRDAIKLAEHPYYQNNALQAMTAKYIHPLPNTYIYTKSLAEHVVEDLCKGSIPAVIHRPSVVVATISEPFPGWTDNFNGPLGFVTACMKGVTRHFYANDQAYLDHVFVDNIAKSLIAAAWDKARTKKNKYEVTVYNASGDFKWRVDYYYELSERLAWENPFINRIWYGGDLKFTLCWYYYYIRLILFSVLPAISLDVLLKPLGKSNLLLKFQRKMYSVNKELAYFLLNSWEFKNDKYKELDENLLESDKCAFNFYNVGPKTSKELMEYSIFCVRGISKFLLHEAPANKETFRNTKRFYILDRAVKLIFCGLILWILWKCDIIPF